MLYPLPDTPDGVDQGAWEAAVTEVRGVCGWHIAPEVTETVTLNGPGSHLVVLPTLRLVDLVSITNDGTEVTDPEWSESGMVRAYCWTWKYRGVVAEMTHGYEEWPLDLLAVMTEMASASTSAFAGIKSVTSGPHSFTLESTMTVAQRDVIGRYALPFLAI